MTTTAARTYEPPAGPEWHGFGHRIIPATICRHICTACGCTIQEGSTVHTWVMPISVDAYPYGDDDWRAHEATTEYRGSLTRCYECLHCYVASRYHGRETAA